MPYAVSAFKDSEFLVFGKFQPSANAKLHKKFTGSKYVQPFSPAIKQVPKTVLNDL